MQCSIPRHSSNLPAAVLLEQVSYAVGRTNRGRKMPTRVTAQLLQDLSGEASQVGVPCLWRNCLSSRHWSQSYTCFCPWWL